MSDTVILNNTMLKNTLVDAPVYRDLYTGDFDDAPIGIFGIRPEVNNPNNPRPGKDGLLECIGGQICKVQRFYISDMSEVLHRARWYDNRWSSWKRMATESSGGGKTLHVNNLHLQAERRAA